MRRLTQGEYVRSVSDAFALPLPIDLDLEPDETTEEFLSIGASQVGTSEYGVEQYRGAAFDVAALVWERRADYPQLAQCAPTGADDPCVREALATFGRRLWRRSLSEDELDRHAALVDVPYEEGHDPALGLQYALVESPHFIYVPFVGEDDPDSGLRRLNDLELASRLSYFLWGSAPDEALLDAAEAGELHTAEQYNHDHSQGEGMAAITRFIMHNFATFAEALCQRPEGAGTVLDNTLIVGTSEHAIAGAHNYTDHPYVLVGGAGGGIKAGMHWRHPSRGGAGGDGDRGHLAALAGTRAAGRDDRADGGVARRASVAARGPRRLGALAGGRCLDPGRADALRAARGRARARSRRARSRRARSTWSRFGGST